MKRILMLVGLLCVGSLSGCCCRTPCWGGSTYAAPQPIYPQQAYVPMPAPVATNYCPCP